MDGGVAAAVVAAEPDVERLVAVPAVVVLPGVERLVAFAEPDVVARPDAEPLVVGLLVAEPDVVARPGVELLVAFVVQTAHGAAGRLVGQPVAVDPLVANPDALVHGAEFAEWPVAEPRAAAFAAAY